MEDHFAALRLPQADHDVKLTRAFSFSELPTARRVCLKQCYESGDTPGLVRQYSCEQIFDKLSNTKQVKISEVIKAGEQEQQQTWEATVPFNAFKIPQWPPRKNNSINKPPEITKNAVEYMEIDDIPPEEKPPSPPPLVEPQNADQKPPARIIEACKTTEIRNEKEKDGILSMTEGKGEYQCLKKKLRPLVPSVTNQATTKKNRVSKITFFILLPVAILTAGIVLSPEHFGIFSSCNDTNIYCKAREDLKDKIYGQKNAMLALSLVLIKNESPIKILCFIGGTGVGKSHTANIIKDQFPFKNSITSYYPPLQGNLNLNTLSSIFCNLIVIENLKEKDLSNVSQFLSPLSNLKDYCVTVIAIFNIEHVDKSLMRHVDFQESTQTISDSLRQQGLEPSIITFNYLDDDALTKCIEEAAAVSKLTLSADQINHLKNKLSSANAGCKGAYSKVQIIGRE